ncbi:rim15, signal transduction response regulator, partial [Kickxella alabastrina]
MLTTPLIAEDEFKPTPFLAAIMDLVSIIGHVLGLSAEDMLRPISGQLLEEALAHELENGDGIPEEERQHIKEMLPTEYLAQRLDILGNMWEQSPSKPASPPLTGSGANAETSKQQPWPCRGLFFRALLAISLLNRIVMWYVAVVSTYSDNIVEELGRRSGLMPGSSSNSQHKEGVARANATEAGEPMSVSHKQVPSGSHMLLSDSPNAQAPSVISRAQSADKRYLLPQDISDSVTGEDHQNTWQGYQASHPPRWYGSTGPLQNTTAVDKGLNMLLEVGLDERIRYISPTCRRFLDTDPTSLIDQQAKLIFGENDVPILRSAVEQLLADGTRTVEMNVQLQSPNLTRATIVEAKGMLIYDRLRNKPSHVLWVLRYVSTVWPLSQRDVPADDAAEAWSKSLPGVAEIDEPPKSPSLMETITCRICDREIPEAYFEEHTWLCAQSHRAAMDVEHQNDRLSDIRAQIQAWYPGCHIEELEDLMHGGTDADTLRGRAQQKAIDIGNPTWQKLLDESSISTQSMAKMCLQAMALDDADAVPKCEWGAGRSGKADLTADVDFVRSNAWVEVANYRVPQLRFKDLALEALGKTIVATIANKLSAIDDLQYAIVESSEAYSKWVLPEDSRMALDTLGLPGYPSSGQATVMGGGDTVVGQTVPTTDSESDLQRASASPWPEKQSEPFQMGQAYVQKNVSISSRRQASISSSTSSTAMGAAVQKTSMSSSSTAGRMGLSEGSSAFLATPTMPSINDFTLLKPISKGAYGSVFLAKKRTTGDYYAIKILKKADMIAKNQISNVKAERAIMMAQTGSPFVVRLLYTFQSRTNLYLVMDYLNGGDCASLIKTIGALPLDWARQYLAEVVLGIGDLHGRNVVHRDLKPDNLLIDSEGHLKLTDFGLSKLGFLGRRVDQYALHPAQGAPSLPSDVALHIPSSCVWQEYVDIPRGMAELQGQASAPSKRIAELKEVPGLASAHAVVSSIADASSSNSSSSNLTLPAASQAQPHNHALGTPDYIAPESILGLDSGKSVDWWALGVICYEFLFGIPPFHDDTPEMVFRNILSAEVDFYDELREQLAQEGGDDDEAVPEITPEARDFITRLLCRDPRRRLGYGGASEVKAHAFFYGIDWTTLLETQPAFVPQTESMEDTEYFDARGATLDLGPEADSIAECGAGSMKETISRSLEELSVAPEIGQSVPLRRQNTVPLPLPKSHEYIINAAETADNTKPKNTAIDENPEFGTFTFKNLHALEKANMDELYKLRRRNTMLDTPSSPLYHPETRSSFGYGSSSDIPTVPPLTRRNRSQTEHSPLHFELPPFQLSSSTGWHGAHDSGHSQYHRGSLLNPGANVSSISSHDSHSSNRQPSRTSEYFPDVSLPPTPRKQDPADILLPPSMGHTYSASKAIVEPEINNEYLQSKVCLVADDNPVCCKIMDIVLRRLHLDCIVVRNGAEAIRCAMGRTVFRAIFMDTGMPIVGGDEATRMIKSTYNANKETPIIGMVVYEGEATEALYDGTIVKPVTFVN